MVNFNGNIISEQSLNNRSLHYSDGLFESMRLIQGKIPFWKDHYNRLIDSMKILKMEMPVNFSSEFLHQEICRTVFDKKPKRIKLLIWRNWGGKYTPDENGISYYISSENLDSEDFHLQKEVYQVGFYAENKIQIGILSTLKTTNRIINVLGSLYAKENKLDNCFLINDKNQIAEALNGNIFAVYGNRIKTPPLNSGCLNGIMRKQILKLISKHSDFMAKEVSLNIQEISDADELWITNSILGIIPVSKFQNKHYKSDIAAVFVEKLNDIEF